MKSMHGWLWNTREYYRENQRFGFFENLHTFIVLWTNKLASYVKFSNIFVLKWHRISKLLKVREPKSCPIATLQHKNGSSHHRMFRMWKFVCWLHKSLVTILIKLIATTLNFLPLHTWHVTRIFSQRRTWWPQICQMLAAFKPPHPNYGE